MESYNTRISLIDIDEEYFLHGYSLPPRQIFPDNIIRLGSIIQVGFRKEKYINGFWSVVAEDYLKAEVISCPINSQCKLTESSMIIKDLKCGLIEKFKSKNILKVYKS